MSDGLIGKQLGDYQIRGLLGRGGMARVYAGYDSHLDRLAAVKVIANDYAPEERAEYFERFQREARAIARLNHPNIVGVYQFGQYDDQYYMAMVFVEGRDLRQVLRDYTEHSRLMPFNDVLNVARGIGSALDYAHARGVIHRDVKPSNIMIARDKRAVLTDFGLALSTSDSTLGETFGSAHYIAPEQALSSANATDQSDLYSLGVCVYEMLTGRVPFDDPSAMTVALKHVQEAPTPPRELNPGLSPAVEYVLLRALEKDPANRFASGVEFARALKAAYDNQQLNETASVAIGGSDTPLPVPAENEAAAIASGTASGSTPRRPVRLAGNAGSISDPATVVDPFLDSWDEPTPTPITSDTSAVTAAGIGSTSRSNERTALRIGVVALVVILAVVLIASGALGVVAGQSATSTASSGTTVIAVAGTPALTTSPGAASNGTEAATTDAQPVVPSALAVTAQVAVTAFVPATSAATTLATSAGVPAGSPSPALSATTGSAVNGSPVRLVYDNNQLDLINVGNSVIGSDTLNQVTFTQDGTNRSFDATTWIQYLQNGNVPAQGCIQAFRAQFATMPPLAGCTHPLVYRRPSDIHLFWTTDADGGITPTSFRVLITGQTTMTCQIKDGVCDFIIPNGS